MARLRKRHSWPSPSTSRPHLNNDINTDPFAFFISNRSASPQQEDIEIPQPIVTRRRTRSMPLLRRRESSRRRLSAMKQSPVRALMGWIERMEKQYFHYPKSVSPKLPSNVPQNSPIEPLIVTVVPRSFVERSPESASGSLPTTSTPLRGRGNMRCGSANRVNKNVKTPPRRPRAWREPSTDIWSIREETMDDDDQEDVIDGLGISNVG